MQIEDGDLTHYGILRRSGRYPWGSSGNVDKKNKALTDYISDLRKKGMSDKDIAKGMGITSTQLRQEYSIALAANTAAELSHIERLKAKGMSNGAIAERLGLPGESSVRSRLAASEKDKSDNIRSIANVLKTEVDSNGQIDVGRGIDVHLGVSQTKLNTALTLLQGEGYAVHKFKELQQGTGLYTEFKVLVPGSVTQKEAWLNREQTKLPFASSDDGGRSFDRPMVPLSVDPKRVDVLYKSDGGDQADGVIYVRPGVDDITLGGANYAQVRVKVGDGHYLKGMAMYKDDLPEGVDLLFNTNKESTGNKLDALKKIESDDPVNPFGSSIKRQIRTRDANGDPHLASAMNIVNEEGDWGEWSKTLSTQMLSKQNPSLAKQQLNATYDQRIKEFDELKSLTNPTVKRNLLEKFADETDSAAVQLDAAALSTRQGYHAILPIKSLPPGQIYAPGYKDGERVVLIRFPHGGTFEIPELVVNNKHPESKRLLKDAKDAVGIHHSVAERLSGADFDGDAVLVIPNGSNKIKTTPALEKLKDFDPRSTYRAYDGMPKMTPKQKGLEMGMVSNLITDMTIKGASQDKIARAVKHSMVVIDAEKHHLNYKQSAIDNGIAALKEEYQGGKQKGASTLFSRATSEIRVPERKDRLVSEGGPIDPVTGKKMYSPTNREDYRTGGPKMVKSKKLAETDDAHTLSSGTRMESIYAEHSNKLKGVANQARLEASRTPRAIYNPPSAKAYAPEVASLNSKLAVAKKNAPLERQAVLLSNAQVRAKRHANPNMDDPTLKKVRFQALEDARARTGAGKKRIQIEQNEWDAIQAGAITDSKVQDILANADIEVVRSLATPRPKILMTSNNVSRAKAMLAAGHTRAEVASALGVSLTTLDTGVADG